MDATASHAAMQTHRQGAARLQRELRDQFDSVVEFADFCAFVAPDASGGRAQQLIDQARGLYEETLRLLHEHGHDE